MAHSGLRIYTAIPKYLRWKYTIEIVPRATDEGSVATYALVTIADRSIEYIGTSQRVALEALRGRTRRGEW